METNPPLRRKMVESTLGTALVVTALVTNIAGSSSNLAVVLALRRLPPGTLVITVKIRNSPPSQSRLFGDRRNCAVMTVIPRAV